MPLLEQVEWAPGRKKEFLSWIHHELYQTFGDREELENTWENQIIQWRAKLPEGELDWPFVGASNLELPLTAMHSDPVFADMIQTFHAPEDYWTPVAKRPDRVDTVAPLREAMTAIERQYLKMRRVNLKAFLDNNILGTAIYKNNWKSEKQTKRRYLPDGSSEKIVKSISQPQIEHVPLQRFYFPADAWDVDMDAQGGARWLAQEFFVTPGQLKVWARGSSELPAFDDNAVEEVLKYVQTEEPDVDRIIREEDEFEPFKNERIRLFEVWARFDADGDGLEEDIVVILGYEQPTLLRAIYNPNAHGRHPFHVTNYLPSFGIYGIGMAEVDEWAQTAGTDLLNAQIDNALLANTRMYSAPLGSNVQPGEPVYPGKIWFTNPGEKISEVRLSEVYPSIFQSLQQLMQFSELRSGVSELRQGNLSGLPSRTPATSLLSILREGNKRFDMIHSSIREVHSNMGLRMLQNVAQRTKEEPTKWASFLQRALGEEDARKVLRVLTEGRVEQLEEAFGVAVTATSAQVNKEVEKQSFIGMLQITQQIYQSLVQTGMMMAQVQDPVVQATSKAAFISGVDLLKQLLERFDVQNPSQYLGNLETIAKSLNAQESGQNAGTAGLAQLLQGAQQQNANNIPPQLLNQAQLGSLAGF